MNETRIRRVLGMASEPIQPDPEFADALYVDLGRELGFVGPASASGGRVARRRLRGWRARLLLVAVLALGVGAAVAAGAAWQSWQDSSTALEPPDVCALITSAELSAIEGAPVWLIEPAARTQVGDTMSLRCLYEFDAPVPGGAELRTVEIKITVYPSRADAAAFLRAASSAYGSIPNLGEGATVLQPNALSASLLVLIDNQIIQIAGSRQGTFLDLPRARQIAELILERR